MTSKELVKEVLGKWRLPMIEKGDDSIVTRFQMNHVYISALADDTKSAAVVLPRVFTADNEAVARLALNACNELNLKRILLKFYMNEENEVMISSEFFYNQEVDVEAHLRLALYGVVLGKQQFFSLVREKGIFKM